MSQESKVAYEGPRTPRPDEWDAVCELERAVFFPDAPTCWTWMRRWPMSLHPDARQQALTIFHDGRPVSSMNRLVRDMLVHGHRLRLGYIGAVCTDPAYRGQGLASTLLDATLRQLHAEDVDLVYISGTRGLYYGAGANHAAIEERSLLALGALNNAGDDIAVRLADEEDIDVLVMLAQGEGVRVIRPRADWEFVIQEGHCRGRPCAFYLVERGGVPVAYLLWQYDRAHHATRLIELAGDRASLLAALSHACRQSAIEEIIEVNVPHGDLLALLLAAQGVAPMPARSSGTIKLLDLARTMGKLLPYFRERLPGWDQRELHIAAGKERYVVWTADGWLQVEGESQLLWLLLGRPADAPQSTVVAHGTMQALVERCLPLPLPWLHLNMI